jgi:hypothetical protein
MTDATAHTMMAGFNQALCIGVVALFKSGVPEGCVPCMPWRRLEKHLATDLSGIPQDVQRTMQSSEVARDSD